MRIYCFDFPTGHEGRSGRRWRPLATNTDFGFGSMEIEAVWPGITKIPVICGIVRSTVQSKDWLKELMGFRLMLSAGRAQGWGIPRAFLNPSPTSTQKWQKPFSRNRKAEVTTNRSSVSRKRPMEREAWRLSNPRCALSLREGSGLLLRPSEKESKKKEYVENSCRRDRFYRLRSRPECCPSPRN